MDETPRTFDELRRITAEANARFQRLAAAWDMLTADEQERLAAEAERLSESASAPTPRTPRVGDLPHPDEL